MEQATKLKYFLLSLVLAIVFYPFLEGGGINEIILQGLFSATLIFGVSVISSEKHFLISLILAIATFATVLGLIIEGNLGWLIIANYIFSILFYSFIMIRLLTYITSSVKVHNETIYAAVCVYLLMGATGGMIYLLIEQVHPGSFLTPYKAEQLTRADLIYFSYVTLTTTGYGDIIAASTYARSFAILESIIGVLYVAVLISRLVGGYSREKDRKVSQK